MLYSYPIGAFSPCRFLLFLLLGGTAVWRRRDNYGSAFATFNVTYDTQDVRLSCVRVVVVSGKVRYERGHVASRRDNARQVALAGASQEAAACLQREQVALTVVWLAPSPPTLAKPFAISSARPEARRRPTAGRSRPRQERSWEGRRPMERAQ